MVAPLISLYLGVLVVVAIVAWIIGTPMWRAARPGNGHERVVVFRGQKISVSHPRTSSERTCEHWT